MGRCIHVAGSIGAVEDLKRSARELTYRLLEQTWTGAAYVVVPAEKLAEFHAAFVAAWAAMLSAFSSGIAHADPSDPQLDEREQRLSRLQRVVLVAPGAAAPSNAQAITFVSPESPSPEGALRVDALPVAPL
jgi:hypothetical protein